MPTKTLADLDGILEKDPQYLEAREALATRDARPETDPRPSQGLAENQAEPDLE